MPYSIIHNKRKGKYEVLHKRTGERSEHDTMAAAQAQVNLLRGLDHGMKKKAKKGDSSEEGEAED